MEDGQLKTGVLDDEKTGIKFTVTQFGAMRSLELMSRLINTIGPVLGAMQGGSRDDLVKNPAVIMGALAGLRPEDASALVLDVLKGTEANMPCKTNGRKNVALQKRETLDAVFSGRLPLMFKVFAKALEVNFGDFSDGSDRPAPLPQAPSEG